MFKLLLLSLTLLTQTFISNVYAQDEPQVMEHKTVALVLGTNPEDINVPSVELYRKVKNYLDLSDYWVMNPAWSTKKAIGKLENADFPYFGSIPFFDRSELKNSLKNGKEGSGIIAPVQVMLDTLALEGAILVDCEPIGDDTVKACGLYFYDRASRKIVAAAEKEFVAGVKDASNWAGTLTSSLAEGMNHIRDKREKLAVNSILEHTKDDRKEPMQWLMEMQLHGGKIQDFSYVTGTVPSGEFIIGMTGENYGFGLGGFFTQNKEKMDLIDPLFKEVSGQLLFTSKANAGESLTWDFHLGAGYAKRSLSLSGGDQLNTEDIKLSVGPGLLWNMSDNAAFGLVGKYDRYMEIKSTNNSSNQNLSMFEHDFRIGFRLQTRF
ncbi:MAG: hypothetical protein EP319_00680 [Deltaproteobacteria bacterium]|nr:MAG: hypothetical protein EP319_00680 [Deltaproteobacteria bacterium]